MTHSSHGSASGKTMDPTKWPVSKIVIVLQENHTFDNYFGSYPGANGTAGKSIALPATPGAEPSVTPFHAKNPPSGDLNHTWEKAHQDYDSGKMDGFVYSEKTSREPNQTMGGYNESDISRYWKAARNYVLCDRYFSSVMSQSAPNHLYLLAGTAGGLKANRDIAPTLTFPPIFQQLDAKGIAWGLYSDWTDWYSRFHYLQSSPSAQKKIKTAGQFSKDLAAGKLPDVSWIMGVGHDATEHPREDIRIGENEVADHVVNAVGHGQYWNEAAIFITWDDYGGWYDHVPPPQVDQWGYGFRVPCLVISPFAGRGVIDSTEHDHTSILRFVENRFGLSPLSTRDGKAVDMSCAFSFASVGRPFVPI